jgi:hypothetical protein
MRSQWVHSLESRLVEGAEHENTVQWSQSLFEFDETRDCPLSDNILTVGEKGVSKENVA